MYTSYDIWDNLEPSTIYLARPGHRLINGLEGIEEDTCRLEKNFNNTSVLEFTMDRDINGTINSTYDLVQQHYELYITGHGWFKINEEPVIESDGNIETKSVRAESLEIELQQYDIVDFEINTASVSSKEMLAIDNTYEKDDYLMWHDNVLFYRDTSRLQELTEEFSGTTVSALEQYIYNYPEILNSWRVDFDYETLDTALQDTADAYRTAGQTGKASNVEALIGTVNAKTENNKKIVLAWTKAQNYPELLKHIHLSVEVKYDKDDPTSAMYSIHDIIDLEIQRMEELSLLTILLKEHGWNVGYIDISTRVADDGKLYKLADETGQFQVDTQDIYSFMTQDLASYYKCIFFFDTDTYTVSAYRIESIGLDTNIYLSFHNIQNSVTRNSDKQIYTVFNVLGGDELHIDEANFGESWIEDISYFLTTEHFTQEFIDKYNAWRDYRESRRDEYMTASVNKREASKVASEIYDRVPVDGCDHQQYKTMSDDQLSEEINHYQALITRYQDTYVDNTGEYIGDEAFARDFPRDYSDYEMIKEEIIPNIQIEIYNRQVSSASDTREYYDNWEFDFETYGLSYGVAELQSRLTTLRNQIDTLQKRGYDHFDPIEQAGDAYAESQYNMYLKYTTSYAQCQAALAERTQEYNDAYDVVEDYNSELQSIKRACEITNANFGFTDQELWLLDKYRIHTDYTNENIITTSISTSLDWVQTAYRLYLDAKEELSAESQPQWIFSTTQDNLLLMPEFKGWHGQLDLGNFIRVAMREDYQVKLRVTRIAFNPFLIEPTIDLEFSNMVQYASKRNDFVNLLENGRSSSKNQISSSLTSTNPYADINISSDFLLKLINNGTFSSYMGSFSTDVGGQLVSGITATTINTVSGQISGLVADEISAVHISVDHIDGISAKFQELTADYIDADYIVTEVLRAEHGEFDDLVAEVIRVGTDGITELTKDTIRTETINASQIIGDTGDFNTIVTNVLTAENIAAMSIDVDQLTGNMAEFGTMISQYINVGTIDADVLSATLANIDVLEAGSAFINSAFVQSLQSLSASSATSVISDAYIRNAVVGKISVADLSAGSITLTDNMQIVSENGKLIMNGTALQIIGTNETTGQDYVGIQLGYDTNQNPSLILRNKDGATVLTPQGITQDAVTDGLIINNMIHDGTISKAKLGFRVMSEGDRVSITQVYDENDNAWGVQYTSFVNATNSALDEMSQDIADIASYDLYIETPDGISIRGGSIDLVAHLLRNGVDVTRQYPNSCFVWTRTSKNNTADTIWNANHASGEKILTITGFDVDISTNFQCCFTYDDIQASS